MDRLNYFEPFQSKTAWHEDQLTRAFLVVLRYASPALFTFYDYVRNNAINIAKQKPVQIDLPALSELKLGTISFATQISNIENYISNKVLSVLITDEQFKAEDEIKHSDRGAVYDGVICFDDDITLIIENKPRSYNVWEDQLNPNITQALANTGLGTELIKVAATLEWKLIIKKLNDLIKSGSVGGLDKMIVTDFLEFVNINFPYLNPYDNLVLCNDYPELVNKRLMNILTEIAIDEEHVAYHSGWAPYIATTLSEIKEIGFVVNLKNEKFDGIELSLYFGDTVRQAREFYGSQISFDTISKLTTCGWSYYPNFHISYIATGLVWFETPEESIKDYYNYWQSHTDNIYQYPIEELKKLLQQLEKANLIVIDENTQNLLKDKVYDTKRETVNVCPGFGLFYNYSAKDAKELDSGNKLIDELRNRIREGLGITKKPIDFIK